MITFTDFDNQVLEAKLSKPKLKKAGWPFKEHSAIPKDLTKKILDFADVRNIGKVPIDQINDFLGAAAAGKLKIEEWEPELKDFMAESKDGEKAVFEMDTIMSAIMEIDESIHTLSKLKGKSFEEDDLMELSHAYEEAVDTLVITLKDLKKLKRPLAIRNR